MASTAPTPRRATTELTAEHLTSLLAAVDTFLFDCDGVIWRGGIGIPGVGAVVAALQALGKRCYFVTNNSTKARASYVEVLARVAGIAAGPDAILSSAFAAAEYLRAAGVTGKVYVIGEAGLVKELTEVAGVQCLGMEDAGKTFSFGVTRPEELDKDVKAVVVGFDGAFNYYKLQRAVSYLRYTEPRIPFIATNRDLTYPDAHQLVPGGGTLVAAVEAGAGRAPDCVAGKPSQGLVALVQSATGLLPSRTCMVGDRLDTDIAFGNAGGFLSLLVLTGIASRESLVGASEAETPHYVVDSLGSLAPWLEAIAGAKAGAQ